MKFTSWMHYAMLVVGIFGAAASYVAAHADPVKDAALLAIDNTYIIPALGALTLFLGALSPSMKAGAS